MPEAVAYAYYMNEREYSVFVNVNPRANPRARDIDVVRGTGESLNRLTGPNANAVDRAALQAIADRTGPDFARDLGIFQGVRGAAALREARPLA